MSLGAILLILLVLILLGVIPTWPHRLWQRVDRPALPPTLARRLEGTFTWNAILQNHRILRRTVNTAPNNTSSKPAAPVTGSQLAVRGSVRVGVG
jgi:hypothetical protein